MKVIVTILMLFLQACASRSVGKGMIKKSTSKSASEVLKTAENIFNKKGITLFKVINHHEGATNVGLKLPSTITVIFGNPQLGTPLMQKERSTAIDLPQKLLIYEEGGKTIVMYNDPKYLSQRHKLGNLPELKKIGKALNAITKKLTN